MDHFINFYTHHAADYHQMIAPEDAEGNLLPAIERVAPIKGKRTLDLGSGTGRLPLLFANHTAQMVGLDLHAAMLQEQQRQRVRQQGAWSLVHGDMRFLPFPSGWAEVVTAGWAIGHFTSWYADEWQSQIGRVLQEMHRLAAPQGALVIIETLTTGSLTPAPPNEKLARYYAWLENEWGFTRQEIRTDFQFASVEEAIAKTELFFKKQELAQKIREQQWSTLPEWSGVWGKRV
jgi:ubiquinone/menaquinone biosynthesis C-methylase UbiE